MIMISGICMDSLMIMFIPDALNLDYCESIIAEYHQYVMNHD